MWFEVVLIGWCGQCWCEVVLFFCSGGESDVSLKLRFFPFTLCLVLFVNSGYQ